MPRSSKPRSPKPCSSKPRSEPDPNRQPDPSPASLPPPQLSTPSCDRLPTRFIGCDVGKASITVFDSRDGRTRSLANRRETLDAFVAGLDAACLIVCEATGGYEDSLLAAAVAVGIAAHRADARKVKAFIRSFGVLGKTDALDARALATYGQERHARLARWQAADPDRERLQVLVLTRRDLVDERVAFANRRVAPGAEPVVRFLEPLIACLDAQIAAIDAEVEALTRAVAELGRAVAVLSSIGGVATKTAAALIALMPELGRLDRRKIAALAGLAPHPNQSGAKDAARRVRGGRPDIKKILFMPALSAVRHDPTLSAAYKRLVAAGKKPMVAIVAVMRKLLVIANARLRDAFAQDDAQRCGKTAAA